MGGKPLIASGTIAGAVDASFSQDSELEIWDLDLDNADATAFELQPLATVSTERKYVLFCFIPLTRLDSTVSHGDMSLLIDHGA